MNRTYLRKDYQPYPFTINTTHLIFELASELTQVTCTINFKRLHPKPSEMQLNGEHITLTFISLDGITPLANDAYTLNNNTLTLTNPPDQGTLTIRTTCTPNSNTSLSGLFSTAAHLMTQCEAEGFRRITYFPDRPDVLSTYTVQLIANKDGFPILLSNGNLIDQQTLPNNQHSTTWHDPFPKPSYLFALVAGNLSCLEEKITQRGQQKLLQVYVEAQDLPKAQFAMDSLKAAIKWDESRFDLPLDLERFMIVATSDFNMGAMENKGLNIFNSKFVLAHPETATDVDFEGVEAVVGHEYFHNWTGNRVTCQDWFQLSLKEGLTVYRDQEFSSDQLAHGLSDDAAASARAVKRIDDVSMLRTAQFVEDSGPMAHPIRPNAYEEINNFYTMTVYEKGAEIVRMYETLLGRDGFKRGMDLYFKRHDGQAVTCDDFLAAMSDANQTDLKQFGRWYEQAGTPIIHITNIFDEAAQTYTLNFTQSNPPVGIEFAQKDLVKQALHIPLKIALVGAANEQLIELKEIHETVVFHHIKTKPTPSINRNFSAPVKIEFDYSDDDLCTLIAHDNDAFNRWDATQQLLTRAILNAKNSTPLNEKAIHTLNQLLNNEQLSPAYRAQLFTLPSFSFLAQRMQEKQNIDPNVISAKLEITRSQLSKTLGQSWQTLYQQFNQQKAYQYNGQSAGERALKNTALSYIASTHNPIVNEMLQQQYQTANNMTDRISALSLAVQHAPELAAMLCSAFYTQFEKEALVIDKWFAVQANNQYATAEQIQNTLSHLQAHPAFIKPNPNRLRSLVFAFCNQNHQHFHAQNGSGYNFWAKQVQKIDSSNPQVAARLARTLENWRAYAEPYKSHMQKALQQVASKSVSQDVREVVNKALGTL